MALAYTRLAAAIGPVAIFARFMRKTGNGGPGECWPWAGTIDKRGGYGQMGIRGKIHKAHRVSYRLFVGRIPAGLTIDHLCRVRSCVNPSHLEAVTNAENVRRGEGGKFHTRKTHCPHGHAYDEANTRIVRKGASGYQRVCRTCARVWCARFDAKRRPR